MSSTLLATVPDSLMTPQTLEVVAFEDSFEPVIVAKKLFVAPPQLPDMKNAEPRRFVAVALLTLGALKVFGSLVFMILALILRSRSPAERYAKIVWATLGTLIVSLTAVLLPTSGVLSDLIFAPMPQNSFFVPLIITASAFLMFVMFNMCQRIFFSRVAWLGLQAFVVFVFSASATALIPVLVRMGTSPMRMTSSVGFLVFVGALFGGLAHVGKSLLDSAAAHQKQRPIRMRED